MICFPEGFPGPYFGPPDFVSLDRMQEAARESRIAVLAGMVEAYEGRENTFYLCERVIGPDGTLIGTYRRVLPNPHYMNDYLFRGKAIAPGDEIEPFQIGEATIGVLVCSELWSPELPLILALKGAEIIFAPIGGAIYELQENWEHIVRARAAENNAFVVVCQNAWGMEDVLTIIAGPDDVVAESRKPGVLVADVDLDRASWLRENTQKMVLPKPYKAIPGMLRHRRPELYKTIAEPQAETYDFWFFEKQ
jgi:predicted amidohydrolase